MKIDCVTTFSQQGYEVYGKEMLRTFHKFWPSDVGMHVYFEGNTIPEEARSGEQWHSLDWDKDRRAFIETHTDHPTNYRKQPIKFCHKVFALTDCPRTADWLIWLDGDIETKAPITHEFLASILPDGVVATFLGRKWWAHTESGFLAYRMDEAGHKFLDDLRHFYTSDKIMEMHQTHDCAAFDYLRQTYEHQRFKFHDLGEKYRGPGLDVMAASVLGPYLHHNKGPKRKLQAYGAVA